LFPENSEIISSADEQTWYVAKHIQPENVSSNQVQCNDDMTTEGMKAYTLK